MNQPKVTQSVPAVVRPTHISVTFKIVTPDQKRRINFTLSRLSDSQNDSWSVMFELDERADTTQDFQLVIQLQVDVDHNDNAKAAATAKNGLDSDRMPRPWLRQIPLKTPKRAMPPSTTRNRMRRVLFPPAPTAHPHKVYR